MKMPGPGGWSMAKDATLGGKGHCSPAAIGGNVTSPSGAFAHVLQQVDVLDGLDSGHHDGVEVRDVAVARVVPLL